MKARRFWPIALLALPLIACDSADQQTTELQTIKTEEGKADSSAIAVFLQFEFDGELRTDSAWDTDQTIRDQLLYTIGLLNGERAVGRLDKVELSNVVTTEEGGAFRLQYHAKLPVAWGKKNQVPQSFTLRLPKDVSYRGQESFTSKYKESCVEHGAHDVDAGSMWYYFRPSQSGCQLDPADLIVTRATVSPSSLQTTGKYPEYHKVWEDGLLRVVNIFGKYEDGATTSADAGISGYNKFITLARRRLASQELSTIPAEIPANPGVNVPDVTFKATLPSGKKIEIVALLVDNVRTAGPSFDARYEELSTRADFISYNGHAGLGANIRALARKGRWVADQYVIVFEDGCDSYAYVDNALAEAHALVNPSDPKGTKFVDVLTNAMPAYFSNMPSSTMAIIDALLSFDVPKTYEQIFANISDSQIVLVTGEDDNTFVPGGEQPGGTSAWKGLDEQGAVKRSAELRFTTPILAKGKYAFDMSGDGDADLYIRIGSEPTVTLYDCRPYLNGSNESCEVELPVDAAIHIMVRGYSANTNFHLVGFAK